jgi:hypothetical protein
LLETINGQTGIKPPNWLVQMPLTNQQNVAEEQLKMLKDKARKLTNGLGMQRLRASPFR